MADYDFSSLNDKEFEVLSTDLLSHRLGCHVERFKAGRDGGVDGRFFVSSGEEAIVQCKHWLKSGINALIRHLENTELTKIQKINPNRYIFVTSLELSKENKKKIKDTLAPFVLTESDVFGNEDLNDILAESPKIERRHYKLWINSSNVLETIFNSPIVGRSKHKLEEVVEESNRYVVTTSHSKALEKLEKIHSIIITGAPGVGKTSLADQLCKFYAANGYEFCFIENSLNEAEGIYNEESKQVFYFDDFLGRNFILALNSHQDSHVINFIKRVERDNKKRFVLTSRSNILNQGKRLSDLFGIKKVDKNEYELSITSLTEIDKAKILYNHIWFGDLSEEYVDEIYKENRYFRIIRHKNFNPRLISFVTDLHRLSNVSPENYWSHIEDTLSNPKDVWKNVFDVQVDSACKHITVAIALHGQSISEERLKELYRNLSCSKLNSSSEKSYDEVVKLLVGALLNRNVVSDTRVNYDLFNPSIADYVMANYLPEFVYVDEVLSCLKTPECIANLKSLFLSKVIDENYYCQLIESQLVRLSSDKDGKNVDSYKLKLIALSSDVLLPTDDIVEYIAILLSNAIEVGPCDFGVDYFESVYWSIELGALKSNDPNLLRHLEDWVKNYDKEFEEFIPLSKIVLAIKNVPSDLISQLKDQYIEYLSDDITRDVIEDDVLGNIYDHEECYVSDIEEYVARRVSEFAISLDDGDIEYISECCDVDDIIQSNIKSSINEDRQYEQYREQNDNNGSAFDAINDLFDRS